MQGAVNACQAINRQYPQVASGWYASSIVALQLGGARHALDSIERALQIQPGVPEWALHRARCLHACGETDKAVEQLREVARAGLSGDSMAVESGMLASAMGQHELARGMFEKAVEMNPDNGRSHFNLATVQRFLGDLDAAESSCNKAIALDSGDFDALFLRSGLRKQGPDSNHVGELQSALENARGSGIGEALVCYALAKELEDLEDFTRSFEYLERGANARRGTFKYDVDEDIAFMDTVREVYDGDFLNAPAAGHRSDQPIFVLGLPRSGTTLVERILSSHDEVVSAGELTHFTRLIAARAQGISRDPNASRPDMVRATAKVDFAALGKEYLQAAKAHLQGILAGKSRHFIDKFPQNTLNIGAIHRALPDARIVLLDRHPMDSCYSMYKQVFTDIYHFSYDLEELGRYFVAHQRLMEHWLDVLPDNIHLVRYEDLVQNPGEEARKLVSFCGLEWQDQCLDFQRNRQASTTASASQVRQGIYTSSVGMWKNYERQLEPLRRILDEAGLL
jgi:tetratricopeptide (TPR) repeat protein